MIWPIWIDIILKTQDCEGMLSYTQGCTVFTQVQQIIQSISPYSRPHFVSEFHFLAQAFCSSPLILPICMYLILNTLCSANSSTFLHIRHIILGKEQWGLPRTNDIFRTKISVMELFKKLATSVKLSAIRPHCRVLFFIVIMAEETQPLKILNRLSKQPVFTVRVGLYMRAHVTKHLLIQQCEELTNSGPGMSFLHTSSRGTPNFTLKMNSFQVLNEHLAHTNNDQI